MEDRFKIKRKKKFRLSKKQIRFLILLIIFLAYLFVLYFYSPNGKILKDGFIVHPRASNIEVLNDRIIYSASKFIYTIKHDSFLAFSFNVLDFKVYKDNLYILSEKVSIFNSNFIWVKDIKKEGFIPQDIFFFEDSFCVRWDSKKSLSITLSLYDIKTYKELKTLSFDNLTFIPFISVFDNGDKILLFQNDGDTLVVNFSGEVVWQKNLRPENMIVFGPKGVIDNKGKRLILYWSSFSYNTNSILILNFNGEIIKTYFLKDNINNLFTDGENIYINSEKEIKIITNSGLHKEKYPFLKLFDSYYLNNNLITIWGFKDFISEYKIIKINEKNFIFKGKVKDMLIHENKLYVLIDSKVYIINIYD